MGVLLPINGQAVNAAEIEVHSLSTDNPKPLEGKGFELPSNLAESLGFKYISKQKPLPPRTPNTRFTTYENPENSIAMHGLLHDDIFTTPTPYAWGRLAVGATNNTVNKVDKNYIFAKLVPEAIGCAISYVGFCGGEKNKGADVLAIIKKIILDEAFLTFKKAHLAFNMNDFIQQVNDANREIKYNIIATEIKAIRAINDFSRVIEDHKPYVSLGYGARSVLVFIGKTKPLFQK